MMAALDREKAV